MADFDYKSNAISNPPPTPHSAGEIMCGFARAAVDASLAASDVVGLCVLPKGCMPTDFTLMVPALDSGSSIVMHVGFAKTTKSDLASSTTFIASTTVGKAGGIDKPDAGDLLLQSIRAKNVDRIIAVKVKTVASSAIAGDITGVLEYRAAENADWSSYPSSIASHPLA